ncbi:MAG: hypothetical protein JXR10_08000 [Cyclobacteriaceae bacterium]
MNISRLFLFATLIIAISCSSKKSSQFPSQEEERTIQPSEVEAYWIKFYKIDNQVKLIINGEEIFDSGKGAEKKQEEVSVGFSERMRKGKNTVRIELYNDIPYEGFMGFDKHWEVFYELFEEDVPVEYIHEQADDGETGMVYSIDHEIIVS